MANSEKNSILASIVLFYQVEKNPYPNSQDTEIKKS
jgi:hypothetical protein